jgi:hypothetical protein
MKQIYKVLVGSQAHGLATPESDYDYRGVFIEPTSELLKIGGSVKQTHWAEGLKDDTQWELGHFLQMATKCNPTILEMFVAPVIETTLAGNELRNLFPYIWNKKDVYNSFRGYGMNQRKKFLDNKDNRARKYAVAYLKSLYQACVLLSTGIFSIDMRDTPIFEKLKAWKANNYLLGDVMQTCFEWDNKLTD